MAMMFDAPKYSDRITQITQTVFKGLDFRSAACDGAICNMSNMCGDEYPLIVSRQPRKTLLRVEKPNGIYAHDGLYYVDGDGFYALVDGNGVKKGIVTDSRKQFANLGAYIVIFPDKAYYNVLTDDFGSLEAEWQGTASFADGSFADEEADGCRIVTNGAAFPFAVGDCVEISGADNDTNNQSIIIREISSDGKSLGFYENSFETAENQTLKIKRNVPDMDFVCENENRIWGCKGDEIYASKPGDIFNWNVFDGIASDSYAVSVGSAGDFTACTSYLGYPIFFKENQIYKVYGSKPSDFQVMSSATSGVTRGSDRSLAIAGEILYYLSNVGVMAYSGGIPQRVSAQLGTVAYRSAVAGSDGSRYYISMSDHRGVSHLFCYNTDVRQWYEEDEKNVVGFAFDRQLVMMDSAGSIISLRDNEPDESPIKSMCEFADFVEESPNKKTTAKILIRTELEAGTAVTVQISFDGGEYETVRTITAPQKRSYYLPILVRRCDRFRIRFRGCGTWKLYALTRECSDGSSI